MYQRIHDQLKKERTEKIKNITKIFTTALEKGEFTKDPMTKPHNDWDSVASIAFKASSGELKLISSLFLNSDSYEKLRESVEQSGCIFQEANITEDPQKKEQYYINIEYSIAKLH